MVTSRVDVFEEWQRRSRSFEDITAYEAFFTFESHRLTGGGEPERLVGVPVAVNFFQTLGVAPQLGRLFTEEECRLNGPRDVGRRVFGETLALAVAGVALGTVGGLVVGRVMASTLFAISGTDPATFLAVPALLVLAAAAAGYPSARRAARVDPAGVVKAA